MIKKVFLFVVFLGCFSSYAETIKTDVLVVGGGASGTAAAIQSARSKLKTILVEPGPWLGGAMTAGGMCILRANRDLPSGIWGEFRKQVKDFYKKTPGYDTTYNAVLRFEPYTGAAILKKIADTVKNLTVKVNTPWTAIKKDGTGWELSITQNGKTDIIRAKIVVDATETGEIAEKAGAKFANIVETKSEIGETDTHAISSSKVNDISWLAVLKDYGKGADKTISQPEGYDAARYACLKQKNIPELLKAGKLPNDKYLINWDECANRYPVSTEDLHSGQSTEIFKKARLQTLGLIYYLQTELGFKNLGADDEFTTPDHLPYVPYIRESKRVEGQLRMIMDDIYTPYKRQSRLYRTSIAVGDAMPDITGMPKDYSFPAYSIPMGAVVAKDVENLLVTEKALSASHMVNSSTMDPSVQMILGQGVGTVAAYCAFFKTTTKSLRVRTIQGELLDFKGYLIPFSDVNTSDPYFRAYQQVAATGLLQGVPYAKENAIKIMFQPDSAVKTSEIKPVLNEIYTRGFIWFIKEKPAEKFTVGNLISLISDFTLTDLPVEQAVLQKAWNSQYKFSSFDLKRPVTRREFAVLVNKFLNPFARTVDITGKLVN